MNVEFRSTCLGLGVVLFFFVPLWSRAAPQEHDLFHEMEIASSLDQANEVFRKRLPPAQVFELLDFYAIRDYVQMRKTANKVSPQDSLNLSDAFDVMRGFAAQIKKGYAFASKINLGDPLPSPQLPDRSRVKVSTTTSWYDQNKTWIALGAAVSAGVFCYYSTRASDSGGDKTILLSLTGASLAVPSFANVFLASTSEEIKKNTTEIEASLNQGIQDENDRIHFFIVQRVAFDRIQFWFQESTKALKAIEGNARRITQLEVDILESSVHELQREALDMEGRLERELVRYVEDTTILFENLGLLRTTIADYIEHYPKDSNEPALSALVKTIQEQEETYRTEYQHNYKEAVTLTQLLLSRFVQAIILLP